MSAAPSILCELARRVAAGELAEGTGPRYLTLAEQEMMCAEVARLSGELEAVCESYEERLERLREALKEIAEDRVPTTYGGGIRAVRVRANHALSAGAEQDAFCGRADLHPHRPHHWRRRPDGSYGDYDDEGDSIWCPGSAGAEQEEPDAADMADPHWSGGHPHA